MTTSTPPPLTIVGRWQIIRCAAPARRRPVDNGNRARVYVRCVCGRESVLWVQDLLAGRSTGCRSIKCRARNDAALMIGKLLDDLTRGDRQARGIANRFKAALAKWQVEIRREELMEAQRRLNEELAGDGFYDPAEDERSSSGGTG